MPELNVYSLETNAARPTRERVACPPAYQLNGPQVEPEASHWLECFARGQCPAPRPITLPELLGRINPADPANRFPTAAATLRSEMQEVIILARLRDEPAALMHVPTNPDPLVEPARLRLPLSMFLQLRPQPLGAVVNTARDEAFPVIGSGRELARYVENETPGLPFQVALNYMIRETMWSPPRQAWIWAALNTTIHSALMAAWYFKWRGGPGIQFRPRPWECFNKLDVLYDRLTNSTNSGDGPRRGFPGGVRPEQPPVPFRQGEQVIPESGVPDVLPMPPTQPSPGTPRHPAYPSGHSTYSAAAARLLIEFFPRYREELCRLADNIGVGRIWAGVHWRSDHTFGQKVGTAVAELVIQQMRASGIPRFPVPRPGDETPPNPPTNPCPGGPHWAGPHPRLSENALCRPPMRRPGAAGAESAAGGETSDDGGAADGDADAANDANDPTPRRRNPGSRGGGRRRGR